MTFCPPMAMNSTVLRIPCGSCQARSATPSRCSTPQQDGFKQSPQTFSRGNFSRSRTSTPKPPSAQNVAQLDPAGPPPTIATSNVSIAIKCNLSCRAESRHLSLFASLRLLAHDLVPTHIEANGLVSPNLPRCRYSVAIHITFLLLIGLPSFRYSVVRGST